MEREEQELLLKDLQGRLLYGVLCTCGEKYPLPLKGINIDWINGHSFTFHEYDLVYRVDISKVRPFLRPLNDATNDELNELSNEIGSDSVDDFIEWAENYPNGIDEINKLSFESIKYFIDWINKYHFDLRGLIPKGLGKIALKNMYLKRKIYS